MYQCICDNRKIPDVVGGGGGGCQIFFGGLIDIFSVETPL